MHDLNMVPSREKAHALIMAGKVTVDGKRVDKPGTAVKMESVIELKGDPLPFVSRGGLKLQRAVHNFSLTLQDLVAADIGASTGGFTDCMLQNGAKKVYAIDVGYGQLDWGLRNDLRVTVMERMNARYMEPDWFEEQLEFASIDVSFISIKLILPPLYTCLKENARVVALIKPQFEAGRSEVQKHRGVVRDSGVHAAVIMESAAFAQASGYVVSGLAFSPITGPKGNIEFLILLEKNNEHSGRAAIDRQNIDSIVREAHIFHKI